MPSEPRSAGLAVSSTSRWSLRLRYSIGKLSYIGKDMDYLPLLFENELRDHAMREEINKKVCK